MELTARNVIDTDIPVICGFPTTEKELFFAFPKATFPLTPAQLSDAVSCRSDSTVAEYDGRVVGFANLYRWETGGTCSIGNVMVSPSARGLGVGRFLVEQMIHISLTRHRASEITLACFNENVVALLLYGKLGFKPFDLEVRKDAQGDPAILIHMRLTT